MSDFPAIYLDTNVIIDAVSNGRTVPDGARVTPGVMREVRTFIGKGRIPYSAGNVLIVAKAPEGTGLELFKLKERARIVSESIRRENPCFRRKESLSDADIEVIAYAGVTGGSVFTNDRLLRETGSVLFRKKY